MYILNYKDDSWTNKITYKFKTKKEVVKDICKGKITFNELCEFKKNNFIRLNGITIWVTKD